MIDLLNISVSTQIERVGNWDQCGGLFEAPGIMSPLELRPCRRETTHVVQDVRMDGNVIIHQELYLCPTCYQKWLEEDNA